MKRERYIYFMKPIGMDGPIKIGCSWFLQERLKSLSMWSPIPLEIIITHPGGLKLERNIHECFSDLHSHHEWFRADQRLIAAIDRLKSGQPIEQAINLADRRGSIFKRKCGGAGWSEVTRQKMRFLHRVRHARKRLGEGNYPADIHSLVLASDRRLLTEDELAKLNDFCDSSIRGVAA